MSSLVLIYNSFYYGIIKRDIWSAWWSVIDIQALFMLAWLNGRAADL